MSSAKGVTNLGTIKVIRYLTVAIISLVGCMNGAILGAAGSITNPTVSHQQWDDIVRITKADPDSFAGVSVDGETGVATVYVTSKTSQSPAAAHAIQAIDAIAASPKSGPVAAWILKFAAGVHSTRELDAAMDMATHDTAWQLVAKPYLSEWYVDPAINAVRINVSRITPELQAAATQTFGSLAVLGIGSRMIRSNRQSQVDTPPWWGGDGVEDSGASVACSDAFPVMYQGYPRVMTAGHCWLNGNIVDQPTPAYRCLGSIFGDTYGGGSYDIAVIDLTYCTSNPSAQGYVWYRGYNWRPIGGMAHAYVGDQACFDGAVTEENCSGYENADDVCVIDNYGITVCHLARASSNTSTVLVRGGDSGGPVYEMSGKYAYAQGMIEGYLKSSGGITGYFSPMWRADQDYGYTVITCGC